MFSWFLIITFITITEEDDGCRFKSLTVVIPHDHNLQWYENTCDGRLHAAGMAMTWHKSLKYI